jgi:hypothetical protein
MLVSQRVPIQIINRALGIPEMSLKQGVALMDLVLAVLQAVTELVLHVLVVVAVKASLKNKILERNPLNKYINMKLI